MICVKILFDHEFSNNFKSILAAGGFFICDDGDFGFGGTSAFPETEDDGSP